MTTVDMLDILLTPRDFKEYFFQRWILSMIFSTKSNYWILFDENLFIIGIPKMIPEAFFGKQQNLWKWNCKKLNHFCYSIAT